MCGIAGYVSPARLHDQKIEQIAKSIATRGRDSQGDLYRHSDSYIVHLFHSRLAIIDIHSRSNQPMSYQHLDMVFNGEIYNFNELKNELKQNGYSFSTNGDSEVLLKAFHCWGEAIIDRLEGMFAFAIVDNKNNKLFLVRDRAGVKPLFYFLNDSLMFSSNMSTLLQFPEKKWKLDGSKVLEYLNRGYVRAPNTLITGIKKLMPGSFLKICLETRSFEQVRYWELDDHWGSNEVTDSQEVAVVKLKNTLIRSVKRRLIADCDIGVLLSSGYDSSTLAAVIRKEIGSDISAFTLGFEGFKNSENKMASEIASHIGIQHKNLYTNIDDAKDTLKLHPNIWDEPIGDVSCIPTAILCKEIAKHVKVALSADGVDESFAGYEKYQKILKVFKIRDLLWRYFGRVLTSKIMKNLGSNLIRVRNNKLRLILIILFSDENSLANVFYEVDHIYSMGELKDITTKQHGEIRNAINLTEFNRFYTGLSHLQALTRFDFLCNQQENILPKVDKASMYFGLEVREPLLSKDIIEFGAQCADEMKISQQGQSKFIIRELNCEYLPVQLMNKPKKGFTPPLEEWFNEEFDQTLDGFLNRRHIIRYLSDSDIEVNKLKAAMFNQKGFQNAKKKWAVLVLVQWLDHNQAYIRC